MRFKNLWCFILIITATGYIHAEQSPNLASLVKNGSVVVESANGKRLLSYRDTELLVPASILKIATAFCAIETLGGDFHYETEFLKDSSKNIYIKASGDPSLVSETLDEIASKIASITPQIQRIIIDTSLFADNIRIDGSERSTNPYDAKNSAFVANFSSAMLTRTDSGEVLSAEPQTPLTPLALSAGRKLPKGRTDRINLAHDIDTGVIYGGEILKALLIKHGASGSMQISKGIIPETAKLIYKHRSPQKLTEVAKTMLKYSNNFTANQIFLTLGIHKYGSPATTPKAQKAIRECLIERADWGEFHVEEGSGLSRKNRITTQQMNDLLIKFEKYSYLLTEKEGFLAKTGTLRGVNSLAGYFTFGPSNTPARFAIIINSDVPFTHRYKVANQIKTYLINQESSSAQTR